MCPVKRPDAQMHDPRRYEAPIITRPRDSGRERGKCRAIEPLAFNHRCSSSCPLPSNVIGLTHFISPTLVILGRGGASTPGTQYGGGGPSSASLPPYWVPGRAWGAPGMTVL